ncbi:MAG: DUF5606 domain-containing protein [Bacteroidota bacterium]
MDVEIKDIVALTGAPGLFQVVKADDKAIVIESLDSRKKRQLVKGNMMVSKLMDVSIYTSDDSEPLVHILQNVKEKYGSELPVSKKSSKDELMEFLGSVLPDYDPERVYPSNVKKLLAWYRILNEMEVSLELPEEEEGEDAAEETTESGATAEEGEASVSEESEEEDSAEEMTESESTAEEEEPEA